MRLLKLLKYIIFFLVLTNKLNAQQLPVYSQYMMNRFLINPAIAGAEGYTSFNLTAREQWLEFDKERSLTPHTQAISGQTRLLRNSFISRSASINKRKRKLSRSGKVGVGGYIANDQTGIYRRTGIQATYAYHLNTRTAQLSFGLSGSMMQFHLNKGLDNLVLENYDDPLIISSKDIYIPDANFGFYFVNQKIDAGFSMLQLFQSALRMGDRKQTDNRLLRHYYLNGGFRYSPRRDYIIEPSVLMTITANSFQLDIGSRLFYQQNYWGGLTYRTAFGGGYGDLIFQGGVKVNNFLFGYSFDYTLSSIRKYTLGSHEIMMAVKIGDNARRYRWLNRY